MIDKEQAEQWEKAVAENGAVVMMSEGIHFLQWITWDVVVYPDGFYFIADGICNEYTDQNDFRGRVEVYRTQLAVMDIPNRPNRGAGVELLYEGLEGDEALIEQARKRHEWQLENRSEEEWRYRRSQLDRARSEALLNS